MEVELRTIQKFLTGDESAFAEIYSQYRDTALRAISKNIHNAENAEEVLQDVFLKVHRFRNNYDPTRSLGAWITTLAQNTSIDWIRSNRRTFAQPQVIIEEIRCRRPLAEEALIKGEILHLFNRITESLSKLQHKVMWMRLEDQLSYSEIADHLDLTLSAVKCAMYRAKQSLLTLAPELSFARG